MKKFIIKLSISLVIGIIVALTFNYLITSELIISYFVGSSQLYSIIVIVALLFQILIFTMLVYFILTHQCPKIFLYILTICYFLIMVILLFGRPMLGGTSYNLNILDLFNSESIITNIFNFIFFLPIGYFFRKKNAIITTIIAFVMILLIELIQLITHRGMFDIVDLLVDTLAIITGYFLSKYIFFKGNSQKCVR